MIRKRYAAKAEALRAALLARGFEARNFALHAERGDVVAVWFWLRSSRKDTEIYVLFSEIAEVGLDVFADWAAARARREEARRCPIAFEADGFWPDFSFTVSLGAARVENRAACERERKRNAVESRGLMQVSNG